MSKDLLLFILACAPVAINLWAYFLMKTAPTELDPEIVVTGYQLVKHKTGQPGIKCLDCGWTSYNHNDVAYRYCGHCDKFHYHVVH